MTVATQVPVQQTNFYRDYPMAVGHIAAGVALRDVGTALGVQATLARRDDGRAYRDRAVSRARASRATPTVARTAIITPGRTPACRAPSRPDTNGPANMPPSTDTR